ncbi:MAG: sigma-70 family RNA polymerase sigma factor [Bacillota bacterium]|nr:sigma-70 family RNA polymerase sigma factor [Bacillota bacterium]
MHDEVKLRLLKGDIVSFEYLVTFYEKKIYCFIYNIVHNRSIAEDLTQDVFVKIYENIYKYNSEYPIEPWMFKICYNLTLNYLKKNKLEAIKLQNYVEPGDKFEEYITKCETREIILKEIRSFKPDIRAILQLRIIEDFSFEQIAEILNKSTASIKLKFYRSRKVLIKNLSEYFNEVKL